jgi:hypothetical protein
VVVGGGRGAKIGAAPLIPNVRHTTLALNLTPNRLTERERSRNGAADLLGMAETVSVQSYKG